jgi:hypothetical protein
MGRKTGLVKFEEVTGTRNPILFSYPARTIGAGCFLFGAFFIGMGWLLWKYAVGKYGDWFVSIFGILLPIAGIGSLAIGAFQLFIHRHLEIDEKARTLTTVHRPFWGWERRSIYPFGEMNQLITEEHSGDPETQPSMALILEMKDGRQVDLGSSYSLPEGHTMADRLCELTVVPRSHEVHPPGP